jgi:hypothetical protein
MASKDSIDTDVIAEFYRWAQDTFGPGVRAEGCVKHIRSELEEVLADPTDTVEWCDVMILGLNGATRAAKTHLPEDATPEDIARYVIDAFIGKLLVNYQRTWARDADGLMSHVKDVDGN